MQSTNAIHAHVGTAPSGAMTGASATKPSASAAEPPKTKRSSQAPQMKPDMRVCPVARVGARAAIGDYSTIVGIALFCGGRSVDRLRDERPCHTRSQRAKLIFTTEVDCSPPIFRTVQQTSQT